MQLITVDPSELEPWARMIATGFGERFRPERLEDFRALDDPERTLGWREDGAWVGGGGSLALRLPLPGGAELPVAGITAVAVLPTHRRRGLLRGLMEGLLAQAREREEPLAALVLGGVPPAALAAAGRLEERMPGALARLHAMLAAPRAPWCPLVF